MKEKIKEKETKRVGWYNKSSDHFFCFRCFTKMNELNKEKYKIIREESLENDIYTCDRCGKVFDKENKNRQKKRWWQFQWFHSTSPKKLVKRGLLFAVVGAIGGSIFGTVIGDLLDVLGAYGMLLLLEVFIMWVIKNGKKIKKNK